jgi:hypothetical protein
MTLLENRKLVFARINSTGTFSNDTYLAANAQTLCKNLVVTPNVEKIERGVFRPEIGRLPDVKGTIGWGVTFEQEILGSINGTAGEPPNCDVLWRACGMQRTINSGTAVTGAVRVFGSLNRGTVVPTSGGTYTGTKSGILHVVVTDVVTDTSVDFQATFYPADGTAALTDNFQQTGNTAVTLTGVAAGVTIDFGDPSSTTAGIAIGDRFVANLTSDQEVNVVYSPRETGFEKIDLATNMDGNLNRIFGVRGSFSLAAVVGGILTASYNLMGIPGDVSGDPFATVALPTSGVSSISDPPILFKSSAALTGGDPLSCVANLSVDMGMAAVMKQCAQSKYGFDEAVITGRNPVITLDPQTVPYSTRNPYAELFGNSYRTLEVVLGDAGGNGRRLTIEAKLANTTDVSAQNRDGVMANLETFQVAQDDNLPEITFTFD